MNSFSDFTSDLHLTYAFKEVLKGLFKSLPVTMTHLSESGGTFIEARLTWVRLNAELKNWRKVGRESLVFLEKNSKNKRQRQILKWVGMGGKSRTEGEL